MASHQHAHGNSENVLGFTKDNKVFINDEPLKNMFLHADVKNRKIVAFSIIGAYRKGKSFFLDYCLRYLYAHYPSINNPKNSLSNPTDWLGDENEPLSGFSWRSGTDRVTTGIVIWNDVFLHKDEATGNEIAIIVVDTHGLFDNVTSSMDNSRIFTLDILISSIQVFNLSGVIQDDHLQFLQSAIECAKFASKMDIKKDAKCFQNLVFLIRDWTNTEEFYYGIDGGRKYLDHFIGQSGNQKVELAYLCESILNSYDDVSCALLPHPGKVVATGTRGYNGSWKKIDEDFTEELDKLVDHLLKPENLAVKKVNGSGLNGDEFYEYVNSQLSVFEKDELLQSQSVLQSMTMKEMEILLSACIEHYKQVGNEHRKNIQNECEIPLIHEKSKESAMQMYNEAQKMGSAGEHENYRKVLDRKIEEIFKDLIQQHEKEKRRLKEEKEKLEKEMEEKQRKELERIQKEKEAAEAQLEKVKQESKKALELENQKKQQELDEITQKLNEECAEIEKRKELARQTADDEIRALHDKVEETRIEAERRQREQKSPEQSTQDQHSNADNVSNVLKENEEPASNIISNPTRSQSDDIKLESENDTKKEINSQMQTIVAEDNVIKIEESKPDTPRSDDIADLDIAKNEQGSTTQESQTTPEISNLVLKEYDPYYNIARNTFDSSKESSTIDIEQSEFKQSQFNPRSEESKFLAREPTQTVIDIEQITSEIVKLQEKIDKVNDEMSKEIRNEEVNFDHDYCQPGASTSTDHKDDSDSSWEKVEFPDTSSNSKRNNRQDRNLDGTATNKDQRRMEEEWKLVLEGPPIIKLITYSEQNDFVINAEQLTKIFGHETVKNRKIVAVLITGDDSEDKIKTLNICLDYLYGKYQSLYQKNQNRRKYVQSSTLTSGSASLEMWNDVFLHTSKDNGDIAIVLMNIQGLFGNHFYNCLKIYLISTLMSSVQVINVPDILTQGFTCCQRLGFAWNSWDSWSIVNLLRKIWNAWFLPRINGTVFAYFNKSPEQKILPFLHPDNLIIKKINGLIVTGFIFITVIVNYHEMFQQSFMPNARDVVQMTLSTQIDVIIESVIKSYNDYMLENSDAIKSKEYTKVMHEIAVQNAKSKLEDRIKDTKEFKSEKDVILAKLESKLDDEFAKNQENKNK
ncbi:uncharacterized protein [Chironomus tepperi]|uniref:uncharacterized protein isoform X2 n=1 Tax=Chironomus tepperi TaxID=113505 RepID=UPI00391FA700